MRTRLVLSGLLVALAAVLAPPLGGQPASNALTIVAAGGQRQLPMVAVGSADYVALEDVAAQFGATLREDRLAGGMTVAIRGGSILLTADQPVVQAAGRLVSLSAPVVRQGARWLVPLDFLSAALAPAAGLQLDLRRASRLLVVGDLRVPRVVTRITPGADQTTVTFEITPPTAASVTAEQGELVVRFDADALELSAPAPPTQPLLRGLSQSAGPAAVSLATGPRYGTFRSETQADSTTARLTVHLLPTGADAPAPAAPTAPAPEPAPAPIDIASLLPGAPAGGIRTIVLDPGHGGDDTGVRGPRGTLEKDVTLAIARRLRTLIESRLGLRVFMTRDDDRTVSLDERAALANNHRADLFLSIHANAALLASMRGAEVYYLSAEHTGDDMPGFGSPSATLPVIGGGTRAIDLIVWDAAQTRYLNQSAVLARYIEQALAGRVPLSPRSLQEAPFRVLVGANMPAALVEVGYLSNPDQETALSSAEYQDRIAQALYDAIVRFREAQPPP